jgi:glycosyltransferase involved in cell wall biosynthesis
MMRVLYDHQLFSRQNAGGASRYFYELARYCSAIPEVRCELLMGVSGTVYPFQKLSSPNTHVMQFAGKRPIGLWRYVANEVMGNSIAPFLGTMDIYHPTLYRCMPLVRARRIVATHHDCTQERFPQEFHYARQVVRAKKALYSRADAIICVSESCRKDLLDFYPIDPGKTRVIHHGLTRLVRCNAAACKLWELVPRPYLLYVGSRASYKNFDGLLRAFCDTGIYQSLDLLALGGGALGADELTLVGELGIAGNVICLPIASDELLAEAYARATLFVYPSLYEGFGLPPLEAMGAGCPVLASHTSSIPEVCQDAPFYFDPTDQDCFNRQLLVAICDEKARTAAIERGKKVAAKYNWNECGERTLALYHECQ